MFRTYTQMGFTVVEFTGESLLFANVVRDIQPQLYALIDEQNLVRLVLDLSKVKDISSQFMGTIIAMHTKASKRRGKLVVCGLNDKLSELMQLTRLDRVIPIKANVGDAVSRDAFL